MQTIITVLLGLTCASSLDAQITATLNRLPDDSTEIRIRNDTAVSVAAFVLSLNYVHRSTENNAPLMVYVDSAIDPAAKPLLPGQERVVMPERVVVGNFSTGKYGFPLFEQPIVTAGIFADGTTAGDATLLTRMMLRRSNMLLAVETTLETLSDAGRHNVPRDKLIEQFRKMADSLNRWYLSPEQQVGRGLYQSIMGKLMNLPEAPLGSPFPPSAFVAQESSILNRQRIALSESQPSLANAVVIGR